MKQYHDALRTVLETGVRQSNRTGVDCITTPGLMLKFDLRDGFPAVTTKKLAFGAVKGELIGFLRGCTSAADFRALGCKVWDQNANENAAWLANPARQGEDDLGLLGYSHGWRNFGGGRDHSFGCDQIERALRMLRTDPTSRRNRVTAWNPMQLDEAALPPCHTDFQLIAHVDDGVLHMTMSQRSCDMFLGIPFNIASYALLLELFAAWSGYTAGTLTMFLSDAHIYVNHLDQVHEQLAREPYPLPKLKLHLHPAPEAQPLEYLLSTLAPSNIELVDYQSHPALSAPMAV